MTTEITPANLLAAQIARPISHAVKTASPKFAVGDRVEGGEGEDYDRGTITEIEEDGDKARVAWDTLVVTPANLSSLRLL